MQQGEENEDTNTAGFAFKRTLTHFTLASKLFSLAVQGLGALLSSNLEGALYKSP